MAYLGANPGGDISNLRALVLLGGQSSRMGTPKHFLPYEPGGGESPPTSRSSPTLLLDHILSVLESSLPPRTPISLSIREDQASTLAGYVSDRVSIITDLGAPESIGPSAGLLAARDRHRNATFLVVACDFPLLHPDAIRRLFVEHTANPTNPVTAFLHPSDLQPEPLLAIWTPESLEFLQRRIKGGAKTGPCSSLKSIWKDFHEGGCEEGRGLIRPTRERWLFNANTREEWEWAMVRAGKEDEEVKEIGKGRWEIIG